MAPIPDILPVATVELDSLGVYQLFKPFESSQQTLFVMPQNLIVSRDTHGKPAIRVVMIRDFLDPAPGATVPSSTAWGYMVVSAKIGFSEKEKVFEALKAKIAEDYPEYQDWGLTNIELLPGTGELGVEVLAGPEDAGTIGSTRQTWIPYGVSTAVGAEVTAQIPLSREQAEIIRQTLLEGEAPSSTLLVKLLYRAQSVFALKPCTVTVTAHKDDYFSFFHEKMGVSGGFWIFSWNYQRERIRQHAKMNQIIKTKIETGDPALQPFIEKYLNIPEIVQRYEEDAVEFLTNISVDRTGKVPDGQFEIRPNQPTLFSSNFFWSYTAYLGGNYGTTSIELDAEGNYHRSISLEGQVLRPIPMEQKQVEVDKTAFHLVQLDQATYVVDVFTLQSFDLDKDSIKRMFEGEFIQSMRFDVDREGEQPWHLSFVFDANRPDTQSGVLWRDSKATLVDGNLIFSVPDLQVKGTLTCSGFVLVSPPRAFQRTFDRFMANVDLATTYFGYVKIDGTVWLEMPSHKDLMLAVRITRPETDEPQIFYLTLEQPEAWVMFEKTTGLSEAKMALRLEDGVHEYEWGAAKKLSANQPTVLVVDAWVGKTPVGS